jgi:hypothetical protein
MGRIIHPGSGLVAPASKLHRPTLRVPFQDSGVSQLPRTITIGGQKVDRLWRYEGRQLSGGSIPEAYGAAGGTLAEQGAGSIADVGTPFLDASRGMQPDGTNYLQAATAAYGQPTTGHLLLEIVCVNWQRTGNARLVQTINGGAGIQVYSDSERYLFLCHDGVSGAFATTAAGALSGRVAHIAHCFIRKDAAGSRWYLNGAASGSSADVSSIGSLYGSDKLTLFATPTGGAPHTGAFACISLYEWTGDAGASEWASIAAERFYRACGIWPQIANGTALPVAARTGRASTAYLDKLESGIRKYYLVGAGWPRVCEREDANGDALRGYLSEAAATNECRAFSPLGEWYESGVADSDGGASLINGTSWTDITEDTATSGHYYSNAIGGTRTYCGVTAIGESGTWLFQFKPGLRRYVHFGIANAAAGYLGAVTYLCVDTDTMTVTHSGVTGSWYADLDGYEIEPNGDGSYQVRMHVSYTRGSFEHGGAPLFAGASAAGAFVDGAPDSYEGDDSAPAFSITGCTYVPALTLGERYYGSPIFTNGAAATRVADTLEYKGDDGNQGDANTPLCVECDLLLGPANGSDDQRGIFGISDGGALTDCLVAATRSDGDSINTDSRAATGGQGDANVLDVLTLDGEINRYRASVEDDLLQVEVIRRDGTVARCYDSHCGQPAKANGDRISVGTHYNNTLPLRGLISDFTIGQRRLSFTDNLVTFRALTNRNHEALSGFAQLPGTIAVNGAVVPATARWNLNDADGDGLVAVAGPDMTWYSGAQPRAPSYGVGSPLLGADDGGVQLFGNQHSVFYNTVLRSASAPGFGLDDFAIHWLMRSDMEAGADRGTVFGMPGFYAATWSGGGATTKVSVALQMGSWTTVNSPDMDLTGIWLDCWAFFDRNEYARLYINGEYIAGASASGTAAQVGASGMKVLGGIESGKYGFKGVIGFVEYYQGANMFHGANNATEWLAVAQEHHYRLAGIWPDHALGTAMPVDARTGRASAAYLDRLEGGVRKYYLVGNNWPRVCERDDGLGGTLQGYLTELDTTTTTNSWNTPHGNWAFDDLTTALSSSDSPLTGIKWTEFTETSATSVHRGKPVATWWSVAPNEYLSWLFFIKPGARRYVEIAIHNAYSGHLAFARIDTNDMSILESGTTNGAVITLEYAAVEGAAGDGYAVRIVAKNIEGAARAFAGYVAGALTNDAFSTSFESYAGNDGAVAFSVVNGALINSWKPYYEGPIYAPSNAATTRVGDKLEYTGDDGNLGGVGSEKQGTLDIDVLLPDLPAVCTKGSSAFVELSDGGSHNDRLIPFRCNSNSQNPLIATTAAGVAANTAAAAVSIYSGEKHHMRALWDTSGVEQQIDGATDPSPRTAASDMPDNLDRVTVGGNYSSLNDQPGGLIANLAIKKIREP